MILEMISYLCSNGANEVIGHYLNQSTLSFTTIVCLTDKMSLDEGARNVLYQLLIYQGYPAKRALHGMLKHGR